METKISYFSMAENDYQFFLFDYEHGRVGNAICYGSQSICERYLKHVIDISCVDIDTTHVLKTHNLRSIKQFITGHIPEFQGNWSKILQADGYYFSTRYPGDEAYMVDKEDVEQCWEAVEETRASVLKYCQQKETEKEDITQSDMIMETLKHFD